MGYTALYRKYRPLTFSEIVGQDHITKTLKNQIIANRVGHAYLLNGGRGTGKTSAAKILARAINCLNPQDGEPCNECEICRGAINGSLTDIIEMDAASNNGVEDIRSIREEVNFLPTKAKYRVYIIDEVHMLTQGAFNALLKTLEEPPEHVKFILATTEPQKLPATILSRCQRFDYKRISNEDISKRLEEVCKRAEIDITQEAIKVISILAEGAMRDALSILERCVQDGENKIDENKVKELVGIPKTIYIYNIISAIIQYDIDNAIKSMEVVLNEGKDITNFLLEIIKYVKDILIYKTTSKLELYNEEEKEQIAQIAKNITKEELVDLIYNLSELENKIKWSTQKTILFQAGIIKLCSKNSNIKENSKNSGNSQNLEERIEKIEKYLRAGGTVATTNYVGSAQTNNKNQEQKYVQQNKAINSTTKNNEKKVETKTKKYPNKSEQYWPEIVNDLKQSGKIVLYTNLVGTTAREINDMTVGIEFPRGITAFGKTILEKQENIREISKLVSIACGKEMQIKYMSQSNNVQQVTNEDTIRNIADKSEIPFNII